jgi:hypothetical protein
MRQTVTGSAGTHKDNFGAKSVPCFPVPGTELVAAIDERRRAGRPVAWAPLPRAVPLADYVAGSQVGFVTPIWMSVPPDIPILQYVELVDFDRTAYLDRTTTVRLYKPNGELHPVPRRLSAAYDADICAVARDHFDRGARRYLGEGRRTWARLGALPWAVFGPDGKLPRRWWEHDFAVAAWQHWAQCND